jgi:hypothetical protein
LLIPFQIGIGLTGLLKAQAGTGIATLAGVTLLAFIVFCLPPRLLKLRPIEHGEVLEYPLEKRMEESRLLALELEEFRQLSTPVFTNRGPWKCSICGEQNPGEFELCWNCETLARGPWTQDMSV